ncbi:phosphatase domain-containing putative toxin [Selenomonas ruminantium]|uniref:Protein-tyrosine phosphatase n=1 Tax=Selenomonas ruminantium TaxID=971 RepID=A0A1H0NEA1_SELRU|nr:hypothetical protein [Selenomonas ruminantium]SDO90745.1 Protein-tyrosine phosphatase [Selenomonas ruminantium]
MLGNRNMKKYGGYVLVPLCCLLLFLMATAQAGAKKPEVQWRLDAKYGAVLPRSLRFMSDDFAQSVNPAPSRQGLDRLRCSASAEFSASGLSLIGEKIRKHAGKNADIYVVDLRKESHGFVNGEIPVSLYMKGNHGNRNLSSAAVSQVEKELLQSIVGKEITFVPLGKTDTKLFPASTVKVESVETEEAVAARFGMHYKRIPVVDQAAPTDDNIDAFMDFYKKLPKNAWLHFHCHAGHGRTTTFAIFYDILRNPDVALDDVAARQYLLGGTNLLAVRDGNGWKAEETRKRAQKIRDFYGYVQANRQKGFVKTYSQWKHEVKGTN